MNLIRQVKRKKDANKSKNSLLKSVARAVEGGGRGGGIVKSRVSLYQVLSKHLEGIYIDECSFENRDIDVLKAGKRILTIKKTVLGSGVQGGVRLSVGVGTGQSSSSLQLACKVSPWDEITSGIESETTLYVTENICPNFLIRIASLVCEGLYVRFFELADTTLGNFLVDNNNDNSTETSLSILAQVTMAVFTLHSIGNKTHNDIHHNNILLMKTDKKSGMYWHYRVPELSFTLTANKYKTTKTYTDIYIQNCGWLALLADFGQMGNYYKDSISSDFQSVFSSVFVYGNGSYSSIESCIDYLREVNNPAVVFEEPEGKIINENPFTLESTES